MLIFTLKEILSEIPGYFEANTQKCPFAGEVEVPGHVEFSPDSRYLAVEIDNVATVLAVATE